MLGDCICIKAGGAYGVVYISTNRVISCATCRFAKTSCVHVEHLLGFITTTESDLPEGLKMFHQVMSADCAPTLQQHYPDLSCLSSVKIPFVLPTELSVVLTQPIMQRFNISEDMAQLVPETSLPCSKCSQRSWTEPHFMCRTLIVTERQLIPANGN